MLRVVATVLSRLPEPVRKPVVRRFFDAAWRLFATEDVQGRELVPDGPCLFIANHLSNADGITLARALRPKRVLFLAGVKLQSTALTRLGMDVVETIFIRPGHPDIEALRRSVEALKRGESILIFPEGGRSRTGALRQAKKGVSLIAQKGGVPVVPVALTGTERLLPINDSDMGGESVHRAHLTVRFGRPFRVEELAPAAEGADDPRQAIADAMMRKLAELLPPQYQGVYADPPPGAAQDPRNGSDNSRNSSAATSSHTSR